MASNKWYGCAQGGSARWCVVVVCFDGVASELKLQHFTKHSPRRDATGGDDEVVY